MPRVQRQRPAIRMRCAAEVAKLPRRGDRGNGRDGGGARPSRSESHESPRFTTSRVEWCWRGRDWCRPTTPATSDCRRMASHRRRRAFADVIGRSADVAFVVSRPAAIMATRR